MVIYKHNSLKVSNSSPPPNDKTHDGKKECLLVTWSSPGSTFGLVKCSWNWKFHKIKCFYKWGWNSFKGGVHGKVLHASRFELIGKICMAAPKLMHHIPERSIVLFPPLGGQACVQLIVNFRVGNTFFYLDWLGIRFSLRGPVWRLEPFNRYNLINLLWRENRLKDFEGRDYCSNFFRVGDWKISIVLSGPRDSCCLQASFQPILLAQDIPLSHRNACKLFEIILMSLTTSLYSLVSCN